MCFFQQIGRWITPYRRRVGHWLTPASHWLPVFLKAETCNFTLKATDNGHPWVFDVSLRFSGDKAKYSSYLIELFNSTIISTFDSTYNTR